MEAAAEILKRAAVTLEKYRKNKTLVPPEDLAGKYKVPFEKLKKQLAEELAEYLKAYSLEQLILTQDSNGYFQEFSDAVNRIYKDSSLGKRAGRAAFKEFDLEKIKQLAEELRIKVYEEAWVPYFQKHICLYVRVCKESEYTAEGNPQSPRIYNSLVDKFWDEKTGKWIRDEGAKLPAILIYVSEKE